MEDPKRVCPVPRTRANSLLSLGGIYHRSYGGGDKDGAFFFRLVSFYYINSVNMLFLRLPCSVRSGQTDRLLSAGCQQRKRLSGCAHQPGCGAYHHGWRLLHYCRTGFRTEEHFPRRLDGKYLSRPHGVTRSGSVYHMAKYLQFRPINYRCP